MFFGSEPPTPEQAEEIKRQQDEARMRNEAFKNEVIDWIESLPPRHTFLFKMILIATYKDPAYVMRMIGEANGKLRHKDHVDVNSGLPEGAEFFADVEIVKPEKNGDDD